MEKHDVLLRAEKVLNSLYNDIVKDIGMNV